MMISKLDFSRDNFNCIERQTTSKGNQTKYCNGCKWFKGDYLGYEGLAEVRASELLNISNLDKNQYVIYTQATLDLNDGRILRGCVSNNFLAPNESFITIGRLLEKQGINKADLDRLTTVRERIALVIQRVYIQTQLDITEYLANILALDAIILNEDRHLQNLGVIYDELTDTFKPAPIFDNGLGFLSDTTNYLTTTSPDIIARRVHARPFSSQHKKQLREFSPTIRFSLKHVQEMLEQETNPRIEYTLKQGLYNYKDLFI